MYSYVSPYVFFVSTTIVLIFVGAKMLLSEVVHLPIVVSLGVVGGMIVLTITLSLLFPAKDAPEATPEP